MRDLKLITLCLMCRVESFNTSIEYDIAQHCMSSRILSVYYSEVALKIDGEDGLLPPAIKSFEFNEKELF